MTVHPALGAVSFALRDASRPLIVLGPSLGTSVTALWRDTASALTDAADLVGWDLPGHGAAPAVEPGSLDGLTVADLGRAVLRVVDRAQSDRGDNGAPFWYAGVSVGGAVGLHLLLDAPPARIRGAALICTAARFGDPQRWHERAAIVTRAGTPTQVEGSARRWFTAGFMAREPHVATRLLASLQTADRFGYAAVCAALAAYDVRLRLHEIDRPVIAVAGADDPATPPEQLAEIAARVPEARLEVLDGVAHLAPAERPGHVAALIGQLVHGRAAA